jgi:hypothetical protein
MKKLIAAGLMGVALVTGGATAVRAEAPAPVQAAFGWQPAGKYASKSAAYRKARYLERCGYEVRVYYDHGGWCVDYR